MRRLLPYSPKDLRNGALINIDICPMSNEVNHGKPLHIVEWFFSLSSGKYYILDSDCNMYYYEEALENFTFEDGSPLLKEVEGYCEDDWTWTESEGLTFVKFSQSLNIDLPNEMGKVACDVDTGKLNMSINLNLADNSADVQIATDIINMLVKACEARKED